MDGTGQPTSRRNPFRCALAVYALLVRDGRVLLLRRAGSGYWDGWLGLPSGHVDGGEDAVAALLREVVEETGIVLDRSVCHLVLTGHSGPEEPGEDEYVDLYFSVQHWNGQPRIAEPDKTTELVWADPVDLPADTVPYVAAAIAQALDPDSEPLMLRNWPDRAGPAVPMD